MANNERQRIYTASGNRPTSSAGGCSSCSPHSSTGCLQRGACKRVHVYESVRPSLSEGLAPLIHLWAGLQFKGRGDSLLGVDVLGRKSGVLHAS